MSRRLCVRRSDGTVWEPSFRDGYDEGAMAADMWTGKVGWFFRRVELSPAPWWQFWRRWPWVRTGETWETMDGMTFDVVSHREAIACEDTQEVRDE